MEAQVGYVAHSPLSQSWSSNLKFFVLSSSAYCICKKYFYLHCLISVHSAAAPSWPWPGLLPGAGALGIIISPWEFVEGSQGLRL